MRKVQTRILSVFIVITTFFSKSLLVEFTIRLGKLYLFIYKVKKLKYIKI